MASTILPFQINCRGLEPFDLLIGRIAPFALQGLIVVHDHGVQRHHHHVWLLLLQAPQKQLLQHPAEGSGMENVKGAEESLHGMRRGHLLRRHLDHCLVALLRLQLIEITQVPARAVEEEVQRLQKQIPHRYPFDALLDPRKFVQQQSYDSDGLQILHEKR